MSPIQEIKNFFEWINSQSDSTPFKAIKLATNQFIIKLDKLEISLKKTDNNEYKNILDELSMKNENLSISLFELEKELKYKSEGLKTFQEKIDELSNKLTQKENEVRDSLDLSNQLQLTITQIQSSGNNACEQKIVELESEIEEKSYEILMLNTENKRLMQTIEQNQIANQSYIATIEDLKGKLRSVRIESYKDTKGYTNRTQTERNYIEKVPVFNAESEKKKKKESFCISTQTLMIPKHKKKSSYDLCRVSRMEDFISYTTCMASAIEALLTTGNY